MSWRSIHRDYLHAQAMAAHTGEPWRKEEADILRDAAILAFQETLYSQAADPR
jgi:hypothetical protein